jgi:chondroitin AC lyase
MRNVMILMGNSLNDEQKKGCLEVLAQLKVLPAGQGANLVWSADLGFHYGALKNDVALMDSCRKKLVEEIAITKADGIQTDYSFHQHGARLQMYQYGAAYFIESARLAWEMNNTRWAWPQEKIDMLADFILKGWQWMARGINTVPGTIDRSVSRKNALRSADLRKQLPFFAELVAGKAGECRSLLANQNGHGALSGYRYFPQSDFDVYQQKEFSFFIKTISSRTLATESINSENLKGKLLNSGDAYIVKNGSEYFDLMPVWNWEKLPGVTAFKGAEKIIRKPFAGSVSNGNSGMCVMDYVMSNKDETVKVSAKKAWMCHNGLVVALIADIKTENVDSDFYTTLDQCRLNGNVTVNGEGSILAAGTNKLDKVRWLHHNGMAYIPVSPQSFEIKNDTASGSWRSINAGGSDETIVEKVFMPVLLHNSSRTSASAGYVITNAMLKETVKLAAKPTWSIVRNDNRCQAVLFNDGTIMVAFHNAGELVVSRNKKLKVDKPCALLIDTAGKIFFSNPMHAEEKVAILWNGKVYNTLCAADGTTKEATSFF